MRFCFVAPKRSAIRYAALVVLAMAGNQAQAWDCEVHVGLAMQIEFPFAEAAMPSLFPDEFCLDHKSRKLRSQRPVRTCSEDSLYDELYHGAQDPDDHDFRNTPVREWSHQHEAPGRAKRSFDASLTTFADMYRRNDERCGPEDPFATFGRSLHYLQDWGDPTKYLDSVTHSGENSRKSVSRDWANWIANAIVAGQSLGDFQAARDDAKRRAFNDFQQAGNLDDVLRIVEREREVTAEFVREQFHILRRSEHSQADNDLLNYHVGSKMAGAIGYLEGAQARWVELWIEGIARRIN